VSIEVLGFKGLPYFETHLPLGGYVVLGIYALTTLALLVRTRRDFTQLTSVARALLFAATLIAAAALAQTFMMPVGGSSGPELVLLGALPLLAAAAWLGPGPAIVVGLASGLIRAGWDSHRLMQPFELALWAGTISVLLRQPYKGRIGDWLRQPLLTALFSGGALAWPLALAAESSASPLNEVASVTATLSLARPTLVAYLGEALLAGLLVQIVFLVAPSVRPVDEKALILPPWVRRLSHRILFALTPLTILSIIILVGGVAWAAYSVATDLVIDQMARDAEMVSNEVPFFVQVGRSLIQDLARDERLLSNESSVRQARLDEGLRTVPLFQQLIYFDTDGNAVNAYPGPDVLQSGLSLEEEALVRLALEGGIPAETSVYAPQDDSPVLVSFVTPVFDTGADEVVGVLLGRAPLSATPLMQPVVDVLRDVLVDSGEGFIIDEANTILLYPTHPERQLETLELAMTREIRAGTQTGRIYHETRSDTTRQLVYLEPISGHSDWSVVVMVPNQVVVALAAQIALPTLAILLVMAVLGLATIVTIATRLTGPLDVLVQAADRIAAGQLDQPVRVAGEDEVGRLGLAFEDMRHGLKSRHDEEEKLLEVSYAVSASLDLNRALPPILSTVLEATGAFGVRIALPREDGTLQIYAAGDGAAGMAPMDEELVAHADKQGALVVSRMERAKETLKSSALVPRIQSLVALPIRSETVFLGILWLSHEDERQFEETELTFLSNLASQASFAVANARLFEAAEGGRRQLAAILASTGDAALVVDSKRRLLLINPAAEQAFGIKAKTARGRDFEETIDSPELVELLGDLEGEAASVELPQEDGTTWLAHASPIIGKDGKSLGRVVLLSDISYLKELSEMKSTFVNAVAHDLRAPLTFMKGYVTMMPMVGDLNEKQQEYSVKITAGVDQMTNLIEKLLNLGRIEAGAPLDLEACEVKGLVTNCYHSLSDAAKDKKLDYKLDLPDHLPHIPADTTLYRQAIINLIENAVKYTPEGGSVTVSGSSDDGTVTVVIADTGPGISAENLEHLWQPFFRIKDRNTSSIKGSGLGLAIVKGVADRHGGQVRVESEPGKGTTFYLDIPRRQPDEA
jgi:PAS domain S-box-containing protein